MHGLPNESGCEHAVRGVTMKGDKIWTDEEDDILRNAYPDYKLACKRLPDRTFRAIVRRVGKLKLKHPNYQCWTAREITRLKKLYPNAPKEDICAEYPSRTWEQISGAARRYGARRPRPPLKKLGIPALDRIRERCDETGWSIADLERECQVDGFFRRTCWKGRKLNYAIIQRAVKILDGRLEIHWREH